jgi:hypothetical protein
VKGFSTEGSRGVFERVNSEFHAILLVLE